MGILKCANLIAVFIIILLSSDLKGQRFQDSDRTLFDISHSVFHFIDYKSKDTLSFDDVFNKIHTRDIHFIDCFNQDGWSNFDYFEGGYKSVTQTTIELIEIENSFSKSENLILGKIYAENGDFIKDDTLFIINNRYSDNITNIMHNNRQLIFGNYKLTDLLYNQKKIDLDSCLKQKTLIILPNKHFVQFFGGYNDECECEAYEIESNRHYKFDVRHSVSDIINYYLSPNNTLYLFDESKKYLQKIYIVNSDITRLICSNEDGYTFVYSKQDK